MGENRNYISFDIGGTKISAVLYNGRQVISREKISTPQERQKFYNAIGQLAEGLSQGRAIKGYAICVAGAIDSSKEVMLKSPNLGFLDGRKVKKDFKKVLGGNVKLDNDTNCFLRGELLYGKADGSDPVVALMLGTGVGGAVFVNDEILHLAEIGQTVIDRENEEYLTVEDLVSSHGFKRLGIEDPKACEDLARDGDKKSIQIYNTVGTHLGTALGNMINIFDPELIMLGGSIMNSDYLLLEPAKKQMKNIVMFDEKYWPEIKISQLDQAPELGALSMFMGKQ